VRADTVFAAFFLQTLTTSKLQQAGATMPNNDSNKPEMVRIELIPLGAILEVQRGAPLQNLLSSHGMEFPCGGIGTCGGCRVQILEGHVEPTPEEQAILSHDELLDGWRMACYLRAESSMKLKIEQWNLHGHWT